MKSDPVYAIICLGNFSIRDRDRAGGINEKHLETVDDLGYGDIMIDWNFAHIGQEKRDPAIWDPKDTVDIFWQRGGESFLADLLMSVEAEVQMDKSMHFDICSLQHQKPFYKSLLDIQNFTIRSQFGQRKKHRETTAR